MAAAQRAGAQLAVRVDEAQAAHEAGTLSAALGVLAGLLRAYLDGLAQTPEAPRLREQHAALARGYEDLLLAARDARLENAEKLNRSRQLKPTNYARNLFHAGMGVFAVSLYHFVLSRAQALWVLGSVLAVFAALELSRRFSSRWNDFLVDKAFGAISRPSERHRLNSSTLYVFALLLITALFPKLAVEAAILILGVADPAASVIGRRFGRRKLFRDKSVAGSLGFWGAGSLSCAVLLGLATDWPLWYVGLAALLVSLVGAVTELLSSRVDDNFSIPMMCATAGALLL